MASIRKLKTGVRAEVCVNGLRESRMFDTVKEAKVWSAMRETELRLDPHQANGKNVGDALQKYAKEVTPKRRGARWELLRLNLIGRYPLARVKLEDLKPAHLAQWRDTRLTEVAPASVKRELVLIGTVLEIARREWGWIAKNPAKDVTKPTAPPPRDRRISDDEIDRICFAFGYTHGEAVMVKQRCAVAFLFAIETAMRAGEICGLRWKDIDLQKRVARLPITKNGKARGVPLSSRAVELLGLLPADTERAFNVRSDSLSTMFRAARQRAGIDDLTFHDTRHEAITRLASVFNPLELARVVGHSNLNMTMIYFNKSADDLAKMLP